MLKAISQIWNGKIDPIRYFGVNNAKMRQLEMFLEKNAKTLKKTLAKKQKQLLMNTITI